MGPAAFRTVGEAGFAQGPQQDSALTEVGDGAGDFGDRTAQPVDGRNHEGVAGAGVVEHGRKSGPVGSSQSGEFVGEYPIGVDAGGSEHNELGVEVLAGGADTCIAEDRRHIGTVSLPTDRTDLRHAA